MEVDAFIADDVVSVDGKLYALGAGWDVLRTTGVPSRHLLFAVGAIVRVPYTATNEKHMLTVSIQDDDGRQMPLNEGGLKDGDEAVLHLGGEFVVGRPPDLPAGADQLVPVAFRFSNVVFEQEGFYRIVIRIDDTDVKLMPFRVEVSKTSQPA